MSSKASYIFLGKYSTVEWFEGVKPTMDDPEIHSDERILIRTEGVHVKSISFEANLTNKRIILIDRLKKILPQKEIPLATIQKIEAGENAIRETLITLTAITKDGRTRQMVLTFSRESGGNRAKERDEWIRKINEILAPPSGGFGRNIIAGTDRADRGGSMHLPTSTVKVPRSTPLYTGQATNPQALKKLIEISPESWQAPQPTPESAPVSPPESILGTYCTRCGTRVPDGSGFCNKCGTRIFIPDKVPTDPVATPRYAEPVQSFTREAFLYQQTPSVEQRIEPAPVRISPGPMPISPYEQAPETKTTLAPQRKSFLSRVFSRKKQIPQLPAPVLGHMATSPSEPPVHPRSRRKLVFTAAILIIIIIAIVTVTVVLPKLQAGKIFLPGFNGSGSSVTIPASSGTVTPAPQVTQPTTAPPLQVTTRVTAVPTKQVTTKPTTPAVINQASSIVNK
jgi:hypothetical protein